MIDRGKKNVLGVQIDAVDYEATVTKIIDAARQRRRMTVSALAVHGVMTGVLDPEQKHRLNHLDMVVPDGQPVRWALNLIHSTGLSERVYGPTLTLKACEAASREKIPIFLYGSRAPVLEALQRKLISRFPDLRIAGAEPSRFRCLSAAEKQDVVQMINASGAGITFVGLGCPRQEVWAYEYGDSLRMPLIAVGAAFDFHAGLLAQAPPLLQQRGLEWLYRLVHEPRRLWKRYLYLNPLYLALIALQILRVRRFNPAKAKAPIDELRYG